MSLEPCQNPSCKSYGRPHPNCRCHGMAEGGEVRRFCETTNQHKSDCQYFAEGGDVQKIDDIEGFLGSDLADDNHEENASAYMANHGTAGILKNNFDNLAHYDSSVKRGHKKVDDHVGSIFGDHKIEDEDHSKRKDYISKWVEKGGVDDDIQNDLYKQQEAHGHEDGPDHIKESIVADEHPVQNMIMQNAKGRISQYLNGLRPQENMPRLPFDTKGDQTEQKKTYDQALHIASHPLSVMKSIKNGTISRDEIQHLQAMYPDVTDMLQKKLTKQIMEYQLDGKRPNYKIRQGLSLFLGTALSSELTPQNIQAAQSTFQQQAQAPQGDGGSKPKKSTTQLSKSSQSFLTSNQSLTRRQQKQ